MPSPDTTALLVRMPADLHQALKNQAAHEERTMSAVIRRAVRQHIDNPDD